MARDIGKRLNQLHTRRSGVDRLGRLAQDAATEVLQKSSREESWQKRARDKPYTRYCLGAMQEVDQDYTRISVETAERVGKQLLEGLQASDIPVEFRLQGSVPLNVHIRGVSDVDLLTLETSFLRYDSTGRMAQSGLYYPSNKSSLEVLSALRSESEKILKAKYPAATVDTSGGKAIAISGGSLPRPVDVVPSHWYDTADFQASELQRDRGVFILDKKVPTELSNFPFRHIHEINQQDLAARAGLKKAIRLCKNVKNDAIEDGKKIVFPSFDIASTMYHCDLNGLRVGTFYELAVLAETQRFLDELYHNSEKAKSLLVPDGSRRIFDSDEKYEGLRTLSVEMDDLAKEVAKEQSLLLKYGGTDPSLGDSRRVLNETYVAS
ncbi:hypothetical protein MK632_26550 [Rhizobium changzhiense]|uniref:hypothetical protein n=1 Tax=Rhizobium changzhiense TaxID=2692317 RepID=UPI001F0CB560|nr:hypothetical protein [Rhizobium changzhiense]MCH4549281.1 hypothetical protein [Rhizobium changzhiense]